MLKTFRLVCALAALLCCRTAVANVTHVTNEPDSVYLLSYASEKNRGHNGLHFAYSTDGEEWFSIGNEMSFVKSDYGAWGAQKRMLTPWLIYGADNMWHCVWSLNENDAVFAHAASPDLTTWKRQSYPNVIGANCLSPVLTYNAQNKNYTVTYRAEDKCYSLSTTDFKKWNTPAEIPASRAKANDYRSVTLYPQGKVEGQVQKVAWSVVNHLLRFSDYQQIQYQKNNEQVWKPEFKDMQTIEAVLSLRQPLAPKAISPMLIGIFFEDINYAADGGLYAELVQNRDFEYTPEDTKGRWGWCATYAWTLEGEKDGATFTIDSVAPIHINNSHYAVLTTSKGGAALTNSGFDGIVLKKGDKYDFSLFAKQLQGKAGRLTVRLVNENGTIVAETAVKAPSTDWKKATATLTATTDADNAKLQVIPTSAGSVALDMISLFPQKTFKGRKNGLRADLAQTLADMKPRFMRFPGGCLTHGDGIDNIYRWPNSVGPLEARKPMRNIWNYHQTVGLGFYEYFLFCEDIGAEPIPVLAAGVPCQNSATGGAGQQGGIPMEHMDEYIQEMLDLIEYANGDPKKNKWAKMRADAGHPKPFNLKYIGIGNEDLITDIFEERFTMIYNAIREKYPEITVIGTVGPFNEGTDYEEGWDLATRLNIPMVDEHYYQTPGWYLNNQNFYDRYDRNKSKVYLGEYAAHVPGRHNNIQTALSEALHLTNVERNADIVTMTSYAPLLAKDNHTQWTPDLIYFNNKEVKPTVGYHVQKLFGQNTGTEYLPATLEGRMNPDVRKRISYSVVRDEVSGDVIVKLVNLLPASVKMDIDLSSLGELSTKVKRTVLKGTIDDKAATPATDTMEIEDAKFIYELPAYSFTVLRF